ncbi:DUF805 domain-containing protein [Asticcacaulis excentricus]|uniref:DUF805 domain-containing protein n=1 Tax=Asticcacaulis excentricus (strain ATCC 15261 / DSM 4724 / KCTC 12464 / NCIMB 9791 / VKM B-1370 / CB 48) TaxID=573065 RepID=E8RV25_ASTEC|nr:DUF805 domain-containing protein [Asticcacaulis excentricus]ADU14225.1 protein of unknown function DUF805 [Asticcacaulis excentricus CB 48]
MWRFLLSTKGRTARLPYALFMVSSSLAVFAAYSFLLPIIMNIGISIASPVLSVFGLLAFVLIWPIYALSVRRLKDLNGPTWPALFFLLPFLTSLLFVLSPWIVPVFPENSAGVNPEYESLTRTLRQISDAVGWLNRALILLLCLIPGTKGPNRYGPPPGQKAAPDLSVFE